MSTYATGSQPDSLAANDTPQAPSAETGRQSGGLPDRAQWLVAILGLFAGLAAFGIGEVSYKLIPAEHVMVNMMGRIAPAVTAETQSVADARNAALASGALGACLAGCLGIAGGVSRRSLTAALAGGFLGLTLGSALAAAVSMTTTRCFEGVRVIHPEHETMISMLLHGTIWGVTGATAGLAFAVGSGLRRCYVRITAAGLAGAVLGAIVFDLIGAGLFPLADTGQPISTTWPSRLMARLLVALATAALVIPLLPESRPTSHRANP
jgi:hypothetical protein